MSRRIKAGKTEESEVNLTPMLDIVFIMLIFFIVTATFINEKGIQAASPDETPPEDVKIIIPIVVAVDSNNNIFVEEQGQQRQVDVRSVRANVSRKLAEERDAPVIVQASPTSDMGVVIRVMDQAKQANAKTVTIALQGG